MSAWAAMAGGFVGPLVLTTGLRAANALNLTRIDPPFLLGTAFTGGRTRAKALGHGVHFVTLAAHLAHGTLVGGVLARPG